MRGLFSLYIMYGPNHEPGDEIKPTCEGCQARKETCEWGVRVTFRPENAQTMGPEHPSMRLALACARGQGFQVGLIKMLQEDR